MNKSLLTFVQIIMGGFVLMMSGTCAMAGSSRSVLAMPPGDLLAFLPPAPQNWKLTASNAHNDFSPVPLNMRTYGVREYLYVPPAHTRGGSSDTVSSQGIKTTKLELIDTGYSDEMTTSFDHFKPGMASSDGMTVRSYLLEGSPAIEADMNGKMTLTVFLGGRFILMITTVHQDDDAAKEWTNRVNLAKLTAAAQGAPQTPIPPQQVQISRVDQLDPAKSGSYKMEYTATAN